MILFAIKFVVFVVNNVFIKGCVRTARTNQGFYHTIKMNITKGAAYLKRLKNALIAN